MKYALDADLICCKRYLILHGMELCISFSILILDLDFTEDFTDTKN